MIIMHCYCTLHYVSSHWLRAYISATNAVLADYNKINDLSGGCARNAWFPRAITNCVPCDAVLVLILFKTMFTKYNTLLKREKDGNYFTLGHFLNSPSPLQSHSPLKFNMTVKQDKFDLTGNSENYSCFLKLARKIKFKFYFVWYCIKSSSTYPGEYVSVGRESSPMYPHYGGIVLLRKAKEDYVRSCLSSKITWGSKALNSCICCFHR